MRTAFALLAALASAGLACNGPAAPAPAPAPAAPSSAAPVPAAASAAVKAGACASDGDCRTWSSYCPDAPCACRVLGGADGDPKCAGPKVSCFVDPCMNKEAHCQDGACVLTPR
ncbi:MAG: hypothetical protein KF819_08310 [Labilithrix sp.]|nr:hypothetical protein [Labilithrix sp.]